MFSLVLRIITLVVFPGL